MCGTGCTCQYRINVPEYMPMVIALAIAVLVFITVIINYMMREREMKRNYYGKIDKMTEEAVGVCANEEMIVVTSARARAPHNQSPVSGIKVMMRRRKPQSKMLQITTPSGSPCVSDKSRKGNRSAAKLTAKIEFDSTGRALEVIDCLNKESCILEYNERRKRSKLSEQLVECLQNLLQNMTTKHFIVFGYQEDGPFIIRGTENVLSNIDKQILRLRLHVSEPVLLDMLAFECEAQTANPTTDTEQPQQKAPTPIVKSIQQTEAERVALSMTQQSNTKQLANSIFGPTLPSVMYGRMTPRIGATQVTPAMTPLKTLDSGLKARAVPIGKTPQKTPKKTKSMEGIIMKPMAPPVASLKRGQTMNTQYTTHTPVATRVEMVKNVGEKEKARRKSADSTQSP